MPFGILCAVTNTSTSQSEWLSAYLELWQDDFVEFWSISLIWKLATRRTSENVDIRVSSDYLRPNFHQ